MNTKLRRDTTTGRNLFDLLSDLSDDASSSGRYVPLFAVLAFMVLILVLVVVAGPRDALGAFWRALLRADILGWVMSGLGLPATYLTMRARMKVWQRRALAAEARLKEAEAKNLLPPPSSEQDHDN